MPVARRADLLPEPTQEPQLYIYYLPKSAFCSYHTAMDKKLKPRFSLLEKLRSEPRPPDDETDLGLVMSGYIAISILKGISTGTPTGHSIGEEIDVDNINLSHEVDFWLK